MAVLSSFSSAGVTLQISLCGVCGIFCFHRMCPWSGLSTLGFPESEYIELVPVIVMEVGVDVSSVEV